MPRKETTTGQISAQAQQDLVSDGIENYELPKSIITKIAKSAIPENAKLQKETVLSLVKGSTVFINYLAATAHDVALSKQHKSISASDVLKALEIIEFGDMNDALQAELQIYRNNLKAEKTRKERADKLSAKGKAKEAASASIPPISISIPIDPSLSAAAKGKNKAPPLPETYVEDADAGDGDVDVPMPMDAGEDEDEDMNEVDPDEEDDLDEGEGEGEEPIDMMAVEEEEMRRDGRGLEEPVAGGAGAVDL